MHQKTVGQERVEMFLPLPIYSTLLCKHLYFFYTIFKLSYSCKISTVVNVRKAYCTQSHDHVSCHVVVSI